jgi:hypothetical protein
VTSSSTTVSSPLVSAENARSSAALLALRVVLSRIVATTS